MKKFIALFLVLLLSVSCAFAEQAQYANTKAAYFVLSIMEIVDKENTVYTLRGIDDDKYEEIDIDRNNDHYSYTITVFFSEDNETISMRVWNLIDYDAADYADVLKAVNQLNCDYKYITFVADTTDNSVTAKADIIVREDGAVDFIFSDALHNIDGVIAKSYEYLSPYIK